MSKYLCVSVIFLDRYYHGKRDNDSREWPPSPMRLFQAMVAGTYNGSNTSELLNDEEQGLQWLESIGEPELIVAPESVPAKIYSLFVPDNVGDRELERENRLVTKTVLPSRLMDGDTLHYLWRIDDHSQALDLKWIGIMVSIVRKILALGWGIDQVVGNAKILDEKSIGSLSGHRWKSTGRYFPGRDSLRVPITGSLEDLKRTYLENTAVLVKDGVYRTKGQFRKFKKITYLRETEAPFRHYAAFEIADRISFSQTDIAKVAGMLRSLAIQVGSMDERVFPNGIEQYVAGHIGTKSASTDRFSYLPLPTIGHRYSDGFIRRLVIAEPFNRTGGEAEWIQDKLLGAFLKDENSQTRGRLLDASSPTSQSMIARYVGPGKYWTSVTPVILPGHDDGKQEKAEKLVLQSIKQAGLDTKMIRTLAIRKAPFWSGSLHPREYFVPRYLRGLSRWHLYISFENDMNGPLSFGSGRFLGLGILACDNRSTTIHQVVSSVANKEN